MSVSIYRDVVPFDSPISIGTFRYTAEEGSTTASLDYRLPDAVPVDATAVRLTCYLVSGLEDGATVHTAFKVKQHDGSVFTEHHFSKRGGTTAGLNTDCFKVDLPLCAGADGDESAQSTRFVTVESADVAPPGSNVHGMQLFVTGYCDKQRAQATYWHRDSDGVERAVIRATRQTLPLISLSSPELLGVFHYQSRNTQTFDLPGSIPRNSAGVRLRCLYTSGNEGGGNAVHTVLTSRRSDGSQHFEHHFALGASSDGVLNTDCFAVDMPIGYVPPSREEDDPLRHTKTHAVAVGCQNDTSISSNGSQTLAVYAVGYIPSDRPLPVLTDLLKGSTTFDRPVGIGEFTYKSAEPVQFELPYGIPNDAVGIRVRALQVMGYDKAAPVLTTLTVAAPRYTASVEHHYSMANPHNDTNSDCISFDAPVANAKHVTVQSSAVLVSASLKLFVVGYITSDGRVGPAVLPTPPAPPPHKFLRIKLFAKSANFIRGPMSLDTTQVKLTAELQADVDAWMDEHEGLIAVEDYTTTVEFAKPPQSQRFATAICNVSTMVKYRYR